MNRVYNNNKEVYVVMVLLLIAVICGFLTTDIISGINDFFFNLGHVWSNIFILDVIFILYILGLLLVIRSVTGTKLFLYRPIVLLYLFIILVVILGNFNYYFVEMFFPGIRTAEIPKGLFYLTIIALLILAGYFLKWYPRKLFGGDVTESYDVRYWDLRKLKTFIYVLFIIFLLGNILAYKKIGSVALLHQSGSNIRFYFYEEMGILEKFIKLSPVVVMLSGIYFLQNRRDWSILVIIVIASTLAFISTVRFYFVMPLLVILVCYLKLGKKFGILNLLLLLLLFIVMLFAFTVILSLRIPVTAGTRLPGMLFYLQSSPCVEFIDFCRSVQKVEVLGPEKPITLFHSAVAPFLPKQFWSIFDIDKNQLLAEHAYIMWDLISGWQSRLRIGTFGELFLFGGWTGLAVGSVILGWLLGWIDRAVVRMRKFDSRILIFSFLTVILALTPILQIYAVSDMIAFNGIILLVAYLMCRKKAET